MTHEGQVAGHAADVRACAVDDSADAGQRGTHPQAIRVHIDDRGAVGPEGKQEGCGDGVACDTTAHRDVIATPADNSSEATTTKVMGDAR